MPDLTPGHRRGVVKWFSDRRGYGWITPDDASQPQVFLHSTKLPGSGRKTIAIGTPVLYRVEDRPRGGTQAVAIIVDGPCPDGGTCHHDCGLTGACFRVRCCGPLSGVFPDDAWPGEIVARHARLEAL